MINDEWFDKAYRFCKEVEIPMSVNSSTLLAIYHNRLFFDGDTEIDLWISRELWEQKKDLLLARPEYQKLKDSVTGNGIQYFFVGCMIPLTIYEVRDCQLIVNLVGGTFLIMPSDIAVPFVPYRYKEYDIEIPNCPEKCFEYWYGPHWKEEMGTNRWTHGNIYFQAKDYDDAVTVYETATKTTCHP